MFFFLSGFLEEQLHDVRHALNDPKMRHKLYNPKEFYYEVDRPSHFMNFASIEGWQGHGRG